MKKIVALSLLVPACSNATSSAGLFFTQEYDKVQSGVWGNVESASGPGSTLEQTRIIRSAIHQIIDQYNIAKIVDAPCGDFNWMQHVDMNECSYIGIDIPSKLIARNIERYGSPLRQFLCLDLLADEIPASDLIISRDFLVHISNDDARIAIANFKKSGAKYLLTTTFPARDNIDIVSVGWRPINLQRAPFNFPEPLLLINEGCTEQGGIYADKSLGLWLLDDINL